MDDDRPKLSVVAEADPAELEKRSAVAELGWLTREMAANLLRVMRGAGRPYLLPQQIIDLAGSILELSKTSRTCAISSAIEDVLQSALPSGDDLDFDVRPELTIASGSLQLLASTLVYQRAQAAAGSREIDRGTRELEAALEANRKRWEAEQATKALERARSAVGTSRKRAARAKPKPAPTDAEAQRPSSTAEFMKARRDQLRDRE